MGFVSSQSDTTVLWPQSSISEPVIYNSGSFVEMFQRAFFSSEPEKQNINPRSDRNLLKSKHRGKQRRNLQKRRSHLMTSFEALL